MKKKIVMALAVLLLLAGVGVLAYPAVSNYINELHGSYAVQQLQERVEGMESAEAAAQRRLAQAYNAGGQTAQYEDILNCGDGMMGYISIPRIHVYLPIYHGVSDRVLAKGVGHLPESDFPIGGEGNHAVLTGHTGLPGAKLFTDLIELEEGDVFRICILEQELTYRVDQIRVVPAGQADGLEAVAGEDYCTLVTCTPYGINSHRLLVRGVRTQPEQEEVPQQSAGQPGQSLWPWALLLIPAAAAVVWIVRKRKGVKPR